MADAWRRGSRPLAEEFLGRHPELYDHPRAAVRLIYQEIGLRREYGQELTTAEVVRRFPQWEAELVGQVGIPGGLPAAIAAPAYPEASEVLGDFTLLAALGRGARGRVFLAIQPSLADRPVVLKITPRDGQEHLSLARLQHTHIMPLYSMQDLADRDLRVLCMPYLGGATLARLLDVLGQTPPERHTGKLLLEVLDQDQAEAPLAVAAHGPARLFLARASYVQAVCWIGACLADALHYAHERGLLHLDVKPSNVLLTADGQPMLLDFHLARAPLRPDGPAPGRLGGTPAYMPPEQRLAVIAAHRGCPVPAVVDGRADIYSLGVLLYQVLTGRIPYDLREAVRLPRHNPRVSTGLADLIAKCLALEPGDRYPDAAALAADLRRHLSDLPLRGVANRSPMERWRKWRRRRPHALTRACLVSAVLAAAAIAGDRVRHRLHEAEAALVHGRESLEKQEYPEAIWALERGLSLIQDLPDDWGPRQTLSYHLRRARRARAAQDLHRLADQVRLLSIADPLPPGVTLKVQRRCAAVWATRDRIAGSSDGELEPELERQLRTDLLDLGILWADLRVRLAPAPERDEARRDAVRVLAEAEATFGPSPIVDRERRVHAAALGQADVAGAAHRVPDRAPQTAWEHCALGSSLLRSGDLAAAAEAFERAVDLQPQGLWPNFFRGVCAYRLQRYDAAASAFSICVALAPETAECYSNRALARAALGHAEQALRDYDRALQLAPASAPITLNRGLLHYRENRLAEAAADFRRALGLGADPAIVHDHLARIDLARKTSSTAPAHLPPARRSDPGLQDVRNPEAPLRRERR